MVISGHWDNRPVTISVKPNCITISLDDPREADVFSFDYEGRLWTALKDGVSYRRGLNGKMLAKWRTAEGRQRRWVDADEAQQIQDYVRNRVKQLQQASSDIHWNSELPAQGHLGLEKAAIFDQQRAEADVQRYHAVYKPVGILPPDQYMAVVLQATEGCSFNTCNFCSFYKNRPFRIKSPDEFRQHVEAVKDFLGDGLSLRRTVFLGDANALVIPMPKLLPLLDIVNQVYDVDHLGGIYAFLDGFSGEKKSTKDFKQLAARGLERVYIGLESGSQPLLNFLKKPGKPADAIAAVKAMKSAGVAVGIIAMLGAGGHHYATDHVRETIRVLNAMPLDMDDIIYFSEFIESDDLRYAADAVQAGLQPLTPAERIAQGEIIQNGLKFSRQGGTPHISRYDIREFIY